MGSKRLFLIGLALLVLVASSLACGGGDDDVPTDTPVETGVELIDDSTEAAVSNIADEKPECVLDGLFGLKAIKDPKVRLIGLANCVPAPEDTEEYAELVEETARQIEEGAEGTASE